MNNHLTKDIYQKMVVISTQVKNNFRKKGLAIPVKNDDGTISIGNYTIKKTGVFYSILDYAGAQVVDKINLPQTAILVANNLALGKFLDTAILQKDRQYGYAFFEEALETRLLRSKSKSNLIDVYETKAIKARHKKEFFRKDIERTFEKLRKLV